GRGGSQIGQPEVLVTEGIAVSEQRSDYDVCGGGGAGRNREVVGRQCRAVTLVDIPPNAVANRELELKVVFCPTKPARFDVAGDAAAVTDECPVDKPAVVECECRTHHATKVDMAPGLRPIGGKGDVRGRGL